MTAEPKARSRLLEADHETSEDLQRLGFIDKREQRKFHALCLEPILPYAVSRFGRSTNV